MATSERAGLRDELAAVLVRYRRRISDLGGVVPEACLDDLVAVAERHGAAQVGQQGAQARKSPPRHRGIPSAD